MVSHRRHAELGLQVPLAQRARAPHVGWHPGSAESRDFGTVLQQPSPLGHPRALFEATRGHDHLAARVAYEQLVILVERLQHRGFKEDQRLDPLLL
eukprot:1309320-Pyramimonas_sp.AAC.1